MNLSDYTRILVAFSGGKDSISCVLDLMERGVDMSKVEIHHHDIDGKGFAFMDWPCTPAYCRAFAAHFKLKFYESWRVGGFYRHMMRHNQPPAPIKWEAPCSKVHEKAPTHRRRTKTCGVCGELCYGCIGKFPQVTADLRLRWCSSALKIEVMERMLNNEKRFTFGKTLVITGERAQESAARAKYKEFEPHRSDNRDGKRVKRYIDHWRPVHGWDEAKVWEIIKRHKILVHPAYLLGWGRLSCMTCIFGSDAQWASVREIDPDRFNELSGLEKQFGCTIHRTKSLLERVQNARPYVDMDPMLVQLALGPVYTLPITVDSWTLPAGAFGESAGPT